MAVAKAGLGYAMIGALGDSTVQGGGGGGSISVPGTSDWLTCLSNILTNAGYPQSGVVSTAYKGGCVDPRMTVGSGWIPLAIETTLQMNSSTTNALAYASTNTGTVARVYYANTGGNFTVSIDGGGGVGVTTTAATSIGTYTVTGLANTTHTISVTRSSGQAQILGFEIGMPTSGVRIANSGMGGMSITSLTNSSFFHLTPAMASATGFNADLIFMMTEINDATNGTAVATYKTSFQSAITLAKANGASVILVTSALSSAADVTGYTQALYELADTNNIPLIDIQDRWGSFSSANAFGLYNDFKHPNAAGNTEIAKAIMNALAL